RLQIGLQKDDGARGQAVVRIKADDAVLAEKPIGGKAPAEALDLSLVGKKSLVIEIDYGDGLEVGDHVVLGDPVLVRAL
ncbi:MAG TPA: NPCBM/NEW2 domain-containing protein, partial [Caulifigura sp.]|nr:NPCBM/NEW2 domain-containing protein [Caulifigura sp.]